MSNLRKAETTLDEALGRLGTRPLAYIPDFYFALRTQVTDLIQEHPRSLSVKIAEYTYNDGRTTELLVVKGTVRMYYKQAEYNLPIAIWLPERFPLVAPIAYVTPTPEMMINTRNPHVDPVGLIRCEFLDNWEYPGSGLSGFVGDLLVVFSNSPPLYKRPPHPPPAAAPKPAPAVSGLHVTNPLASGAAAAVGYPQPQPPPAPVPAQRPVYPPQISFPHPIQPPAPTQVQVAVAAADAQKAAIRQQRDATYRAALEATLAARLGASLQAGDAVDHERQLAVQRQLQARAAALGEEVAALQREREGVDRAAGELAAANVALGTWLAENEPKAEALRAAAAGEIDANEAIVPADALSGQALHAQAVDLALEDAMAALDKALEGGCLELDTYLRQVRMVSRRQFTARAVSNKIAAQQAATKAQARPVLTTPATAVAAGGPAPPQQPPPPVQLPIGDLWHSTGGILLNPLTNAAQW